MKRNSICNQKRASERNLQRPTNLASIWPEIPQVLERETLQAAAVFQECAVARGGKELYQTELTFSYRLLYRRDLSLIKMNMPGGCQKATAALLRRLLKNG